MIGVPLPGLANLSVNTSPASNMAQTIRAGKNPFVSIDKWTPELISQINVHIDDVIETTGDFTRQRDPNKRHFKAGVWFSLGKEEKHRQRIIKMGGCGVPYTKQANYGSQFVVALLQKTVGDAIVNAAIAKNIIVSLDDKRHMSTDAEWWSMINQVNGKIGLIDANADFEPMDLSGIFKSTEKGVILNLDLVFNIRLATDKRDPTPRDAYTLVADCSRGAIIEVNKDIQGPVLESAIPQQAASQRDIASEELRQLLRTLNI
jgi:hypothetical protein